MIGHFLDTTKIVDDQDDTAPAPLTRSEIRQVRRLLDSVRARGSLIDFFKTWVPWISALLIGLTSGIDGLKHMLKNLLGALT